MIRPDAGSLSYAGRRIGTGSWRRRRLTAGIGHRGRAFPQASVRANLEFASTFAADAGPVPAALIEKLDLSTMAERPAAALSAGQRKRLELGLAIARAPKLLLLDEPFAALDAAGADALKSLLADLTGDVTVIIATHDPQDFWEHADRVIGLRDGRLVLNSPTGAVDPTQVLGTIAARPTPPAGAAIRAQSAGPPVFGRWRDVAALAGMELGLLWRMRRDLGALLTFAVLIMLTISLALQAPTADSNDAAVGGFLASLVFATVTGAQFGFPQLRQSGTLELLLALPLARPAILASQTLAQFVRLLPTALIGLAAASVFFEANLLTPAMIALAVAGALSLSAIAAAYGALLAMASGRAVLGPLLILPAALPVVLAGVLSAPAAIGQTSVLQTLQTVGLGLAYAALIGAVSTLSIEEILVE